MSSDSKPSERLNLDSYNTIPIENWTCDKLVEHYRANLKRKDWAHVLDCIKKDLKIVANLNSVFSEDHRKKAQSIIDHWKLETHFEAVTVSSSHELPVPFIFQAEELIAQRLNQAVTLWRIKPKKDNMSLKRDCSHLKIDTLQKHIRDNNGEVVKISNEKTVECGKKSNHFGQYELYLSLSLYLNSDNKLPDDVKKWTPEDVKKFLISRIKDLDYNETDIRKIRDQDLTGRAFLRLTEEKLTRKPGL
ncbi:933_t:CDS:2 [Diversispora eburnea]|uniref:933_t:CDS:1 n=1 Tax=Diversispora eburnea TaxID=1213867 RepID=A0A9N9CRR1_9GLOM|nr:933_t:CDS:2 [Diversispora eburnea]